MIIFEGVTKQFKDGAAPLNNINFEVAQGEMILLTGPSGAGKTTLLKSILRLERITYGKLSVSNKNIDRLTQNQLAKLRQIIGFIPQTCSLVAQKTIFENVSMPLLLRGSFTSSEINRLVLTSLKRLNLAAKEERLVAELSASEKQLVSIARALVINPKIILADEATSQLDHNQAAEVYQLLEEYHQAGTTILFATHDLSKIAGMKLPIFCLKNGQMTKGVERVKN